MVSNAQSCPRGLLIVSLFVFFLIQLTAAVPAEARVELKIETSLEGDPGDGVLSPSSGSGRSALEIAQDASPVMGTEPYIAPTAAPFRWPFLFSTHPGVPGPTLWLDGRSFLMRDLWEGRWLNASRSHH